MKKKDINIMNEQNTLRVHRRELDMSIQAANGVTIEKHSIPETQSPEKDGFYSVHINENALAQSQGKIVMRFSLPIINMHGAWAIQHNTTYRPKMKLDWSYEINAAQQCDMPYISFFSLDGNNAATVALSCVHDDSKIRCVMNQMQRTYEFEVTVAVVKETTPFDLLISFAPERWEDLTEAYRKRVLPDGKPLFSSDAYMPVYCSWYAVHGAITNEYLDTNAKLAAELGFKTFILDDGWSYDEMKRVCPEKLAEGWYRDIGNWTVSENKLPDFKSHVKYAQYLGLKYMLWTAPFFAGTESEIFKNLTEDERKSLVQSWSDVAFLSPDSPTAARAAKLLENLMKDLELDGLKIDFLDYIPKNVDDPKSRICQKYFQLLSKKIRAQKPDALIEFRQSYATPQMLEFATQFRAGDVPFDFIENIHRLAHIRICLGDKVPCHADPVYFHSEELPQNVARHMIAALAGVPMLSMELRELTSEQKQIISFWLDFYKKHLETFKNGHWKVRHYMDALSYIETETGSEKIVILLEPSILEKFTVKKDAKTIYILNLTGSTLAPGNAEAFDCKGNIAENAEPGGFLKGTSINWKTWRKNRASCSKTRPCSPLVNSVSQGLAKSRP